MPWGSVVRDGEPVAYFELSRYGTHLFITHLVVCPSTGIGEELEDWSQAVLPLATPYRLPDLDRCDPYATTCETLFVTATWYQRRTGDEVRLYAEIPEAACPPRQPYGCPLHQSDVVIGVLLTPANLASAVDRSRCGASRERPCRLSP
jgi:hypothetical protein